MISTVFFTSCSDFLEPKSQSEYRPQVIQSLDELLLGSAYLSPVEITSVFWDYSMTTCRPARI